MEETAGLQLQATLVDYARLGGLDPGGTKEQLIERLLAAYEDKQVRYSARESHLG